MSMVRRMGKNVAALYIAHFVGGIFSFLLTICIARELGDIAFGKLSFALAFTAIFSIFMDLGYGGLAVREVARNKESASKYIGNLFSMRVILFIIVFGAIALIMNLGQYPSDTVALVYIFTLCLLCNSLGSLFVYIFRAFERMEFEALTLISGQLLTVCLGLLALFSGRDLVEVAFAFVIGAMVNMSLGFFICTKKFATPNIEIDFDFWKRTAKLALPIAVPSMAAMIYIKIDSVMLFMMWGDAVVGWYNAAYSLVLALKPIPFIIMVTLFPLMSMLFIQSPSTLKSIYEKSFKYIFMLGLPISIGLILLADRFILLFYGVQFTPSIIALKILACDVLLIFIWQPPSAALVAMDRQNQVAIVTVTCAVINVVLNLILIPHFSYVGAAIATIVTEVVLVLSCCYLVSKHLGYPRIYDSIGKPLISSIIMGLFVYHFNGINLGLLIALAAVLYILVLYLLKGFSKEDMSLFQEAIHVGKGG